MASRPGERPVPAVRRTLAHANSTSSTPPSPTQPQGPISSGLLINVIRTLTTSVSQEQRDLEEAKLQKGYKESGEMIERLIKEHQGDIENCLSTFKDVSSRISSCRDRVVNVRNALASCKTLLECKRDDLKKLWEESSEQRHIVDIIAKLDVLKNAPTDVETLTGSGQFLEAAEKIRASKVELQELHDIDGLSQVRVRLEEVKDALTAKIMERIIEAVVDEPFEKHMADQLAGIPEDVVLASAELSSLSSRLKKGAGPEPLAARIDKDIRALEILDKELRVLERLNNMSATAIAREVRATISLIRVRANTNETQAPDKGLLALMIKMMVRQLESSRDAHALLAERTRQTEVLKAFWRHSQTSIDGVVSEHTGLSMGGAKATVDHVQRLFQFEGACTSSGPTNAVICRPDVYNIIPIYPWLRHLITTIEESSGVKPCTLSQFVETVVMKQFLKTIHVDLTDRLDTIMKNSRSAEALLEGSNRVYEMCSELHHLLSNMDAYAPTLAALWLLVVTEYTGHVRRIYEKATVHFSDVDGVTVSRKKISAAWAADEDISRLLMSLPNWQLAHVADPVLSPMTGMHSEKEIRERNERESEILIGNLGTQRAIDAFELMTSLDDVKRLAIVHESMRTLAARIRTLLETIPGGTRKALQTIRHRYEKPGETAAREGAPLALIEERVAEVESMSSTCLLMLHLELRVHCFFHLLPLAKPRGNASGDDVDPEVQELGRDLIGFYKLLAELLAKPKLDYIFDGLGHLCAAIFIHSSQHMPRLSDAGKKRVCRNIWGVQQRLSQLTGRREAQLDRARAFFELLSHDVDRLLSLVPEIRGQFSSIELSHLIGLAVRSHPVLASQPGALEACLSQLVQAIRQSKAS